MQKFLFGEIQQNIDFGGNYLNGGIQRFYCFLAELPRNVYTDCFAIDSNICFPCACHILDLMGLRPRTSYNLIYRKHAIMSNIALK